MSVQWKDGSNTWVALKDMKNSYPVQLLGAEYAVENKLSQEPAFAWWISHVLKKRSQIISKLKSKYWVCTHKYGIEIPKTVEPTKELDRRNGNMLWWDGVMKEMKNARPALDAFDGNKADIGPGYQKIRCKVIFDVKMG